MADKHVHFTKQEITAVAIYFGESVVPENRAEQRAYEKTFESLGLDAYYDQYAANRNNFRLDQVEQDAVVLSISAEVSEFVLKKTDARTPPQMTRIILRVSERLLSLKEGHYRPPVELRPQFSQPELDEMDKKDEEAAKTVLAAKAKAEQATG